jgi:hypothetical protein
MLVFSRRLSANVAVIVAPVSAGSRRCWAIIRRPHLRGGAMKTELAAREANGVHESR